MTTSRATLDGDRPGTGPTLPPGGQRRRLHLAGQPKPVARARAYTAQAVADWSWPTGPGGAEDDIVLLVAELVANAMLHAGGPVDLVLDASAARLRIEVSDRSTDLPEPRRPHRPGLPGGHGLFIVQKAATRWGAVPHDDGKTVWAEIDARPPERPGN
ncbi:ATP-binding protein [Kitasatospora sp. NPDC028055]|uniref:ATP-binding protein n=1 Tax=Kitasatospora sp. NPDC028055 TaxID=3155653 RepID=UPI0033EEF6B2